MTAVSNSRRRLAALLLGSVVLGACAPAFRVTTDHDPATDFSRLRGWNWATRAATTETPEAAITAARIGLEALVRGSVERKLGGMGLVGEANRPDFRVAWSFGEWRREGDKPPGGGYGAVSLRFPGRHAAAEPLPPDGRALPASLAPYSAAYEEARLTFRIMSPDERRVLWEGAATDPSDFGYFRADQRRELDAAIRAILREFPPGR